MGRSRKENVPEANGGRGDMDGRCNVNGNSEGLEVGEVAESNREKGVVFNLGE